MNSPFYKTVFTGWLLMPLLAAVVLPSDLCQADCGWHSTWAKWHRTWHAPTPLDTPLRPCFIPRTSWLGECDGCAGGCGAIVAYSSSDYELWSDELAQTNCECAGPACLAPPSCGFERLGQIPNDFGAATRGEAANAGR